MNKGSKLQKTTVLLLLVLQRAESSSGNNLFAWMILYFVHFAHFMYTKNYLKPDSNSTNDFAAILGQMSVLFKLSSATTEEYWEFPKQTISKTFTKIYNNIVCWNTFVLWNVFSIF